MYGCIKNRIILRRGIKTYLSQYSKDNQGNKTNQLKLATIKEEIVDEMNRCSLNEKFVSTTIHMNYYNSGNEKVSTAGIPAPVVATDKANEKIIWIVTEELIKKNPFISAESLPAALTAINSFMKFHRTSLTVFKEFGIKVEGLQQ